MKRAVGFTLACVLLWIPAPTAAADEDAYAWLTRPGAWEVGLSTGYGWGYRVGRANRELEDLEIVYIAPRIGIGLSEALHAETWYAASFQLFLEASYLRAVEPKRGDAGGLALIPRLNWLALRDKTSLVPYVDFGLGLMGLDFDLEDQSDGFNFIVQGGVGVRWLVGSNTAIALGWQAYHISNAASDIPNHGINTHVVSTTISTFF
jgi:hypothetical protein